jgi:hypothetical protein
MKYKTYEDVPWYRREPGTLVLLLALLGCSPIILALCVIALTGDVYKNSYDKDGNLQVWGSGNKVAAVFILLIQWFIYWSWGWCSTGKMGG